MMHGRKNFKKSIRFTSWSLTKLVLHCPRMVCSVAKKGKRFDIIFYPVTNNAGSIGTATDLYQAGARFNSLSGS